MPKRLEIKGKRFRHLLVLSLDGVRDGQTEWLCRCDCGKKCVVAGWEMTHGNRSTCGCRIYKKTHGDTKTRLYRIWKNMVLRSVKKIGSHGAYDDVETCKKWLKYENFKDDMGKEYFIHVKKFGEADTTLERKNNYEGYNKKNCTWVTKEE